MEQISNVLVREMEQFKEVIRGFDESLALKASKLDVHGVVQDLRRYTKVKTFEDYKFEVSDLINRISLENITINASFNTLNETLES